jgi:hypothetical protein
MVGGGGFAHLVTLSPLSFSYPFPTANPTLFLPSDPPRWAMYPLGAVVVGRGSGRSGSAKLSCTISPRTYGIFNSISLCLPHSTFHKFIKFLEIFLYTRNTYINAFIILFRVITVIQFRYGMMHSKLLK